MQIILSYYLSLTLESQHEFLSKNWADISRSCQEKIDATLQAFEMMSFMIKVYILAPLKNITREI